MRVLLVMAEAVGGIARHVELLEAGLSSRGIDVTVAGEADRGRLRALARAVDLAHAHGVRAGVRATAPPRAPSTKVVVTWHNAPLMTGARLAAHRAASAFAARRADLTLGASPDLTQAARRAGARDARDTFVVAPPLPAARRARDDLRAELGVGSRPMVLAIGRLQAQKRLDVLVDAARGWDSDGPIVVVAGAGPDGSALRARAAAGGAAVRFLGARDDVADLLKAADVVALPSAWEARALVAQEALRAGVPLVTTPVGGLPDLVGDAALFVAVGDAVALRLAIERVLADGELRAGLVDAGTRQAASWPTLDDMIDSLVATYAELTGREV
jgi:glycosyltransferase involved in cell wall biosynthesis